MLYIPSPCEYARNGGAMELLITAWHLAMGPASSRIISRYDKERLFPSSKAVCCCLRWGLSPLRASAAQSEWLAPDSAVISKFQDEEAQHSHIMEVLGYLTDVYGPRLTNSPNIREAAEYAVKTLSSWGLANVHEESWGPFGRGWTNELFEANEIAPRDFPLIAYPKAWTAGTNGVVTADAMFAKIEKEEDFASYRGKLRGMFVLTAPMRAVDPQFDPLAHRLTDAGTGSHGAAASGAACPTKAARERQRKLLEFNAKLIKFLTDEGAAAWLEPSAARWRHSYGDGRRLARSERSAGASAHRHGH